MVFTDASTKIQEFIKNKNKSIFHLKETSKQLLKTLYNLALTASNPQFKIISEKQCLPNAPFPKGRMFDLIGFTLLTTHINKLKKLAIVLLVTAIPFHEDDTNRQIAFWKRSVQLIDSLNEDI